MRTNPDTLLNKLTYLKLGEINSLEEKEETRDQVCINHILDGRILLL